MIPSPIHVLFLDKKRKGKKIALDAGQTTLSMHGSQKPPCISFLEKRGGGERRKSCRAGSDTRFISGRIDSFVRKGEREGKKRNQDRLAKGGSWG